MRVAPLTPRTQSPPAADDERTPTMPDATPPLIDLATGQASRRIFVDPAIYESELARIYGHCWLFLAHESQLPEPGDFLTTYMGEVPVLVTRNRDGKPGAFFNSCRHRGMRLC